MVHRWDERGKRKWNKFGIHFFNLANVLAKQFCVRYFSNQNIYTKQVQYKFHVVM